MFVIVTISNLINCDQKNTRIVERLESKRHAGCIFLTDGPKLSSAQKRIRNSLRRWIQLKVVVTIVIRSEKDGGKSCFTRTNVNLFDKVVFENISGPRNQKKPCPEELLDASS